MSEWMAVVAQGFTSAGSAGHLELHCPACAAGAQSGT